MLPENLIDRMSGQTWLPEARQKYNKKDILALLAVLVKVGHNEFFQKHGELDDITKAILLHLSHVYNDSWKTIDIYCAVLVEFFNYSVQGPNRISYAHIEDFIKSMKSRGQAKNTINNKVAVLKSFFGFLHKIGLVPYDPAATIKRLPGDSSRAQYRVLSIEEVNALLEHCRKNSQIRDYVLVKTIYMTGIRTAEVVNVKWNDFFQNVKGMWYLTVYGKGSKQRDVYIPQTLMDELLLFRYHVLGVKPDYPLRDFGFPVFIGRISNLERSMTANAVYKVINGLGWKVLDKKVSPHWLRHSFATHARLQQKNGKRATLEALQRQLGHENINTTMKYDKSAHLTEPAGKAIEQIMDQGKQVDES